MMNLFWQWIHQCTIECFSVPPYWNKITYTIRKLVCFFALTFTHPPLLLTSFDSQDNSPDDSRALLKQDLELQGCNNVYSPSLRCGNPHISHCSNEKWNQSGPSHQTFLFLQHKVGFLPPQYLKCICSCLYHLRVVGPCRLHP